MASSTPKPTIATLEPTATPFQHGRYGVQQGAFTVGIGVRWRKAWRDLAYHKTRTLLVIIAIAIGIFAFGSIIGARQLITRELNTNFSGIQPAHATLYTDAFDDPFIDSIRKMPEVAFAAGRRIIPIRVEVAEHTWHDLQLVVVDDFATQSVNIISAQEGAWPPPERQLLVERNSLFLVQADVGDVLHIQLPNGRVHQLPIAGTTHDMNQLPAQIFGEGFAYTDVETLAWLGYPTTYDQLQIRFTGDTANVAHVEQMTTLIEDKVEKSGRTIYRTHIPEPDKHFATDFLPAILYVLGFLGFLSLILSSFLIINTLNAILKQQTRQIAVMKTLGATSNVIINIYLRMVLFLGICALFIALPLGALGAYALTRFIAGQLNFDLLNPLVSWPVIALETAVGIIVPIVAAIIPIRNAARATIHESLTNQGLSETGAHIPIIDTVLTQLGASRPLRLSLRNTFRRQGRLILTLITLILGGAIFISVMTVRASLMQTMEDTLRGRGYDSQVQLQRPYRTTTLERAIGQVPGVTAVEGWRIVAGVPVNEQGQDGEGVFINALPVDTVFYNPEISEGRWLTKADARGVVVHNQLLAKEPHLFVGGPLTLKVAGVESEWQIVGVTNDLRPPVGPTIVYLPQAAFASEFGESGYSDTVQVTTAQSDPKTHQRVSEAIEAAMQTANFQVRTIQTATEDRAIFTERFNIVTTLLTTMALLIAVVGSLGLMGTMTINVLERRREIGVMRAIGAADRTILHIFIIEGLLIGVLSWLGAMILCQPISRFMAYQLGQIFLGFGLNYLFSFVGAGVWLLIVILLSLLASYWPARNAAALRIREILAYE